MEAIAVRFPSPVWRAKWAIGIYSGPTPLEVGPHPGLAYPVLTAEHVTDVNAGFVADPFLLKQGETWFLFFEVWNRELDRGQIACASSTDLAVWRYGGIVLSEPFHLSYPFVFEADGRIYMLPETKQAGAVRLYMAEAFPERWSLVGEILRGQYADPTVLRLGDRWWLFAQRGLDELCVFFSKALEGPWTVHPQSPIWAGNRTGSRPAGRMVTFDGKLYRFAQDGSLTYGNNLRVFEIDTLDESVCHDHEIERSPMLGPAGKGWNAMGMHHIDAHRLDDSRWIAAVDGANLGLF